MGTPNDFVVELSSVWLNVLPVWYLAAGISNFLLGYKVILKGVEDKTCQNTVGHAGTGKYLLIVIHVYYIVVIVVVLTG